MASPLFVEAQMADARIRFREKLQVQLASVLALGAVYFALWRLVRPWDPEGPMMFWPDGGWAATGTMAAVLCVLAVVCALATLPSRIEGALAATLIGAAGVSLRSPQIRAMLWTRQDDLSGLFVGMIVETVVLFAMLVAAAAIIALVRNAVRSIKPTWVYRPTSARGPRTATGETSTADSGLMSKPGSAIWAEWFGPYASGGPVARGGSRPDSQGGRSGLSQWLGFAALELLVSGGLVLLLMQSSQRGQILFSLAVSFFVAVIVARKAFRLRSSPVTWLTPLAVSIVFYVLAAVSSIPGVGEAWMNVPAYSRALPIDWLTVGAGGAALGYWVGERLDEARALEIKEGKQGA